MRLRIKNFFCQPSLVSVIFLVLGIKALIFLFGSMSYQILLDRWGPTLTQSLEIWSHWDTAHYLEIAQYGYSTHLSEKPWLITFPPLYSWIVWGFAQIMHQQYLLAAVTVSGLASVIVGILLWSLVRLDNSEDIAERSVWFLLIFPTSYFLHVA